MTVKFREGRAWIGDVAIALPKVLSWVATPTGYLVLVDPEDPMTGMSNILGLDSFGLITFEVGRPTDAPEGAQARYLRLWAQSGRYLASHPGLCRDVVIDSTSGALSLRKPNSRVAKQFPSAATTIDGMPTIVRVEGGRLSLNGSFVAENVQDWTISERGLIALIDPNVLIGAPTYFANVWGFDRHGLKIWDVEPLFAADNPQAGPYTNVWSVNGRIHAANFRGHEVELDDRTGEIVL